MASAPLYPGQGNPQPGYPAYPPGQYWMQIQQRGTNLLGGTEITFLLKPLA